MEAIILAGGFGTRLAHIIPGVPKPMAPVCDKPFLEYLLDDLNQKGVTRVALAVGYLAEQVQNYFGAKYKKIQLIYSYEDQPLFTGGAIKKALSVCRDENVFIFNGDTYFDVDLDKMMEYHLQNNAELTVATKAMNEFDRYGTVEKNQNGKIIKFVEKKFNIEGDINGGVYLLKAQALDRIHQEKFSFETEYMEKFVDSGRFYAFASTGYFIDIGIPQDYEKAREDFKEK